MSSTDRLSVSSAQDDPTTLVAVGEIDSHTSTVLASALDAIPADRTVTVDLAGVTFVDSSGLGVLVGAHKRFGSGDGQLVLRAPSAAVLRLLDITGLTGELEISP